MKLDQDQFESLLEYIEVKIQYEIKESNNTSNYDSSNDYHLDRSLSKLKDELLKVDEGDIIPKSVLKN